MDIKAIFRNKTHAAFAGLLLMLAVYLGLKALPEESWSGWTSFTAQTMLSSRHWAEDGFAYGKFLFIPIGYSKAVRYLDEPEMRHHARGTVYGGLIGKRLYYTHYPGGYLLPYALLMKAGLDGRHWARLLSIAISIAAVVFMYLFVGRVSTPEIAFFSTLYYAGSTMFLDFADSLANQPTDDLLRFAILFTSVALLKNDNPGNVKRCSAAIWVLYLVYSLTSYDSTFFIFFWLAGVSYLARKKRGLPLGRWMFFGSAPVVGFLLQMAQNAWYLGFSDMWLDIYGIFFARANTGTDIGFFTGHLISTLLPLYYMTGIDIPASLIVLTLIAASFLYAKRISACRWPDTAVVSVLFLGGLVYTAVFSYTGGYDYEGRQLAPAIGLLVGGSTVLAWKAASSFMKNGAGRPPALQQAVVAGLGALLVFVWSAQALRTVDYLRDWPNHAFDRFAMGYLKELGAQSQNDSVIFLLDGGFKEDHPQPSPIEEFYAQRPILTFRNYADMLRDYRWLRARSEYPFDSIVVSSSKGLLNAFAEAVSAPPDIREVRHRYALVVRGNL